MPAAWCLKSKRFAAALLSPVDVRIDLERRQRGMIGQCTNEGNWGRVIATDHDRDRPPCDDGSGCRFDQGAIACPGLGLRRKVTQVGEFEGAVAQ